MVSGVFSIMSNTFPDTSTLAYFLDMRHSATPLLKRAISETYRRREKQMKFNEEHGIVPKTIKKDVREILEISSKDTIQERVAKRRLSERERLALIDKLTKEMHAASKPLEFEHAAYLRDQIKKLKGEK